MYSISSRVSFDKIPALHEEVLEIPHEPIFMIVGNKSDLKDGEREVSKAEGEQLASLNCLFVECSAKNGDGVEEALVDFLRRLRKGEALVKPTRPTRGRGRGMKCVLM